MVDTIQCMAVVIFLMGLFHSGLSFKLYDLYDKHGISERESSSNDVQSPIATALTCLQNACMREDLPPALQEYCALGCLAQGMDQRPDHGLTSLEGQVSAPQLRSREVDYIKACGSSKCLDVDDYLGCLSQKCVGKLLKRDTDQERKISQVEDLYQKLLSGRQGFDGMSKRGRMLGKSLTAEKRPNEPCGECRPARNIADLLKCQASCR